MSLSERIQKDLVTAMKEREELRLATLRMMKTGVKNREIELRRPLEDHEAQQVLSGLIKQRDDSATQFAAGGRPELAEKERAEIRIIETYLPRSLSSDEIVAGVREALAAAGATGPKDMGRAMKAVMAHFQGRNQRVDGKLVSDAVKRALTTPVSS